MWKQAKGYAHGSKPSKRAHSAGSWVSWTNPQGQERTGIVTTDHVSVNEAKRTALVGGAKEARTRVAVIPSDGGDMLPLCLPNSSHPHAQVKDSGRWRRVAPAHHLTNSKEAKAA